MKRFVLFSDHSDTPPEYVLWPSLPININTRVRDCTHLLTLHSNAVQITMLSANGLKLLIATWKLYGAVTCQVLWIHIQNKPKTTRKETLGTILKTAKNN